MEYNVRCYKYIFIFFVVEFINIVYVYMYVYLCSGVYVINKILFGKYLYLTRNKLKERIV